MTDIERWKLCNQMFKHKLNGIPFDFKKLNKNEELDMIEKVNQDLAILLSDIQISARDLLPHYFIYLLNERKKLLE